MNMVICMICKKEIREDRASRYYSSNIGKLHIYCPECKDEGFEIYWKEIKNKKVENDCD